MSPKVKIELKDYYVMANTGIAIVVLALCYLNWKKVGGEIIFEPKIPGKEWWGFSTMLFMRAFMSKVISQDRARIVKHACGIIVMVLFTLAGVFEYFSIDPGGSYWGLVGSVMGVWIGADGGEGT